MPSRNRQNLRSRHIRDEPQRRRHSPHPTLHNLRPRRQTRRTPNRKNHQPRLSQRRRTKNPTVTRQSWPRVCGRAREWRTIRAIPSEPALAHKKTEQFFKPYGHEIHFQRSQSAKQKNTSVRHQAQTRLLLVLRRQRNLPLLLPLQILLSLKLLMLLQTLSLLIFPRQNIHLSSQ